MQTPALPTRLTKNYRLVFDVVMEAGMGTHLAMADVFARARARNEAIGFTTVYRALARLRDLGLVAEIAVPGADMAYYEPAGVQHAHFRCDRCGCLSDIEYAVPARVVGELAKKHGLEIGDVQVSMHGRCSACLATV